MTDSIKSPAAGAVRQKVVIECTYRTTVEELWELWTTKEGFESRWGPEMIEVMTRMGRPTSRRPASAELNLSQRLVEGAGVEPASPRLKSRVH
jgi:hypothetical protein